MIFLCTILFITYRLLSMQKDMRILQLNHYHNDRFFPYMLKGMKLQEFIINVLVHSPFLLLLFTQQQFELFVLMLFVYIYVLNKYMISYHLYTLKITNRVKRLGGTISILYCLFILCFYQAELFIIYLLMLMFFDKEVIYIANCINRPIENKVRLYYINEAKKIVEEHRKLIKITTIGSYGKTSTKNFIYSLLCRHKYTLKSDGSYNNLMGNTITIRKHLKPIHEVLVCEMGSDHVGEIKELMNFIEPQYVVLTSIGNQHLETFKTQHNIIKEKTSCLYEMKENDVAFLNVDDLYIYENKDRGVCKKITFGQHVSADYRLMNYEFNNSGACFSIKFKQEIILFETSLLGYFNIMNLVASISVAHHLGVNFKEIQQLIPMIEPVTHRLEMIKKKRYTLIDNAFNSNEKSFHNSLDILQRMNQRTILITPGLIDLKYNDQINEDLLCEACTKVDEIVLVGYLNREAMLKGINKGSCKCFKVVDTMELALRYVELIKEENYVVLIENDIPKEVMNVL